MNQDESNQAVSSMGAMEMIVDYAAGKVFSISIRCCGRLLGYLKFLYWEQASVRAVESLAKTASKRAAIGAAFDPVKGRIVVASSGRFIGKPTPVMKIIAEVMGGMGNTPMCNNPIGACVEFKGADMLLRQNSAISNIRFVPVIRPRTMRILAPCEHCQKMLEKFDTGPIAEWQDFDLFTSLLHFLEITS